MTTQNAAPMVIDEGTQDFSASADAQTVVEFPQHLPLFYIFSGKGPVGRNYVDFEIDSLTRLYGDAAFDVNKKYYTHQTVFLEAAAAAANNCVVHRLVAPDAKDVANIAAYLDVLPTQVPLLVKNSDGSIQLDDMGAPVFATDSNGAQITVPGYKVAWVFDKTVAPVGSYQPGLLVQRNGIQVDGATQSTQYPIFEAAAADVGEEGNNLALRLFAAQTTDLVPFPSAILSEGKMYPYYFGMTKIADPITGKTSPVLNLFGAQTSTFVLKGKGLDPASGAVIDLKKITADQYIDLPQSVSTGLGAMQVYQNNLDTLLQQFYDAEKNITDQYRDSVINNTENNIHAVNVLSFTSSNGSPYQAIRMVDLVGSVRITRNTNLFLQGGSDGTITNELLDQLVAADMANYSDGLHEYNDLVSNPESIFYDSGFALETKKVIPKMISRRKDTFVVLSTFAHNAPALQLDNHYSVALALKSMLELYPESATFGTPVMRGMVMGGSGELINSLYTERVPTSYELLYMASRYMGARNGAWKNGYAFDRAPRNVITQLRKIDVTWVPTLTRSILWSVGLNFVLNYQIRTPFFPALQTVYENDTSVLNSFFVAVAISYLNKIEHAAWREFTGAIGLTDAQLEEQVNEFVAGQVKDKFDSKFIIIPETTVTERDAKLGYKWSLNIRLGAPGMKTVMSSKVSAYRYDALATQ